MDQTIVREQTPGLTVAKDINDRLSALGIHDVQLMFDKQINMWAVIQINKKAPSQLLLPKTYKETDLEPYILWWCKNNEGRFRLPDLDDLANIVKMIKQAPDIWAKGEKRADKFDQQDADKDRKHQDKFKQKIHEIAPAMKKAIKKGNL